MNTKKKVPFHQEKGGTHHGCYTVKSHVLGALQEATNQITYLITISAILSKSLNEITLFSIDNNLSLSDYCEKPDNSKPARCR